MSDCISHLLWIPFGNTVKHVFNQKLLWEIPWNFNKNPCLEGVYLFWKIVVAYYMFSNSKKKGNKPECTTNKQTNKQTRNKQTNKQTNKRYQREHWDYWEVSLFHKIHLSLYSQDKTQSSRNNKVLVNSLLSVILHRSYKPKCPFLECSYNIICISQKEMGKRSYTLLKLLFYGMNCSCSAKVSTENFLTLWAPKMIND